MVSDSLKLPAPGRIPCRHLRWFFRSLHGFILAVHVPWTEFFRAFELLAELYFQPKKGAISRSIILPSQGVSGSYTLHRGLSSWKASHYGFLTFGIQDI